MALINCTECNTQISDRALVCPKCGVPTSAAEKNTARNESSHPAYVITTDGKKRYLKATTFDIIISIFLPFWGVIVGLVALCKGERQRGATMLAVVVCTVLALVVLASK